MSKDKGYCLATRLLHGGGSGTILGAMSTPIFENTSFRMEDIAAHVRALDELNQAAPPTSYFYSGRHNPTVTALETRLASIESAPAALAFSAGMAAITTSLLSIGRGGGHIIVSDKLFATTAIWVKDDLPLLGCEVSIVNFLDLTQVEAAFQRNTRAVYFEAWSNPLLTVFDVEALIKVAHAHGALAIIDNTSATPALFRPIEYGADLVIHSATKYMAGHGRARGGVVAGALKLLDSIATQRGRMGTIITPHSAVGIMDGLQTLELRIARVSETASHLALMAARHPATERVNYPGLPEGKGHNTARRLTGGRYGGMFSFSLKDWNKKADVYNAFELFTRATSFGDSISLVDSINDPDVLRISTGIEDPYDLARDLKQALDAALN